MTYDIDRVRAAFPALSITDSGRRRIYFDNPAGTQVPQTVIDSMTACLLEANANIGGGFSTSNNVDELLANAHQAAADLLNAPSANDVCFGQNMTTMTLHISRSIAKTLTPGDNIVLTRMDHDGNVWPWVMMAQDAGVDVRWLDFDVDRFEFDLDQLEKLFDERTKLVCVGGASNLTGTLHDIKEICARAKAAGVWSYIDGVQSVPHVVTDVQDIDCDFLVCSAYKFFGPHQGILYGRDSVMRDLIPYKVRPAPDAMPGAFETGTQSHEGAAGLLAAIDYFAWVGETMVGETGSRRSKIVAAMNCLFDYEKELAARLVDGLQSLPGVRILGITAAEAMHRRVPTVSFAVAGDSSERIAKALSAENIFVWWGHNYAIEAAAMLGIIDHGGAVRIGPVHYNTAAEVDETLSVLDSILKRRSAA